MIITWLILLALTAYLVRGAYLYVDDFKPRFRKKVILEPLKIMPKKDPNAPYGFLRRE